MKSPNNPFVRAMLSCRATGVTLCSVMTLAGGVSQAALTWNSAGPTNNWSTAAANENWNPGGVVWSQGQSALFDATSGTPEAINVTTTNTVDNITFDVTGFSIGSGGAGSFVLANDFASTITVTNGSDSAAIAETFADNAGMASSLTKAGAGTLTLNGTAANTHTGGTIISAGTLIASHEGALGPAAVTNHSVLNLNKANITFSGMSVAMTGTGTTNVTALGTGTNTVGLNGNYSGFTGSWNIGVGAIAGAGKVQMNGLDNAASAITVLPNATVFCSAGTHNAAITLKGGDTGENLGQLRIDNTTTVWAGPITLDGAMTGVGDGIIGSNAGPTTISGVITEAGGSRELTKSGGGTLILSATNSYTGITRSFAGNLSVASIGNAGVFGPLGSNGTISLGLLGSGSSVIYTGAGETTNRVIELGGANGNAGINHAGTGLLKFTADPVATGLGTKALVLTAAATGTGEFAGVISDHATTDSTTVSAAFAAAATTITLASVDGITVGAGISGTGIAGGTTITAINPTSRVVTITPGASGAGTVGQTVTVTGLVNRTGLTKDGAGQWLISAANLFTGGVTVTAGPLLINNSNALGTGTKGLALTNGTAGNPSIRLDGSAGPITLPATFTYTVSNQTFEGCLVNLAGNNTVGGQFNITSGGGGMLASSLGGDLNITANITSTTSGRAVFLSGPSTGTVAGIISNGSTTGMPVSKDGTGTWTLTGPNTYTGSTTVNAGHLILGGTATNASNKIANNGGTMTISGDYSGSAGNATVNPGGTLRLDYSTIDTGKLGDTNTLALAGGTVTLTGGSHAEIVGATTLAAGTSSLITRTSGAAVINLRAVTGTGSVTLADSGIATTDTSNVNDILPWARVMVGGVPVLATNSTNTFDGPIVPYTGFTDITRLGPSAIPNLPTATTRIIDGGTGGNITLAASPLTQLNFLQMGATGGPATIAPAAATDVLSVGTETGGSIWQAPGAGSLTIGTTANDGILTTGDLDNAGGALLVLSNDSTNPLVINSTLANNGTDVVSVALGGSGPITVAGTVGSTGTLTTGGSAAVTILGNVTGVSGITAASSGLLTVSGAIGGTATVAVTGGNAALTGNNSFTGALTISASRTVTLAGDNAARPAGITGLTTINNGATLQLQANATNTVAGISSALSAERTANQPLILSTGGLLQLRADEPVTFTGGNSLGGLGSATVNFDVNQLTGAGSAHTLTIAPLGFDVNTTTINVTGGNGYRLGVGRINNVAASGVLTLNPTTAGLTVDGYTANATFSTTLVLGGSSAGNVVSGNILNPATSGTTAVTKTGTSTWTVNSPANTYSGVTTISGGTLIAGSATACGVNSTLNMSGTSALDLNGNNLTFANLGAGTTTATITDNGATPGTSTLAITGLTLTNGASIASLITDGPTRNLSLVVANANGNTAITSNPGNTYSGNMILAHNASGTRLVVVNGATGSPGAIVSGPFGRGSIIVGQANTDKAGIFIANPGTLLLNPLVMNTVLGNDRPGIRVDSIDNVIAGTIQGNLSDILFSTNGVGYVTLTGRLSSGAGTTGLATSDAYGTAVTVTLANTGTPNDYTGDTTIGTKGTLRLGAANQIPNGSGKGNATINGRLRLDGFGETINALNGSGVVTSASGTPVLTVGDNDSSGVFTGSTGGTLAFTKTGSGVQTLGAVGHAGDTTVAGGILSVTAASAFADAAAVRLTSGATLNLTAAGTDTVHALFIDGVQQASGTWGKIGSTADHPTSLITGNGLLNVTTSGSTPYGLWAAAKGLTAGVNDAPTADPDGDGDTNLKEFAFDADPLSGKASGKVVGKIGLVAGVSHMTLTMPVRTGAVFADAAGPELSAAVDGVIYQVEGADALAAWTLDVTEVTGADAVVIQTGLPALATGWTYRTFRAPAAVTGANPADFLRVGVK